MSNLGTRFQDTIRRSGAMNLSRRSQRLAPNNDAMVSTTVSFTSSATIGGSTPDFRHITVGDVIEVTGSPLNSRQWLVSAVTRGVTAVKASGTITFTVQPTANDTVTFNGSAITFKASGATGDDVNIGVSLYATVTALLAALQASVDTQIVKFTYTRSGYVITATAATAGTAGNSLTLATSNSAQTLSGATLSGGVAAVNGSLTVLPALVQTESAGANIQIIRAEC